MSLREAAQKALEALEWINEYGSDEHGPSTFGAEHVLREALAEPERKIKDGGPAFPDGSQNQWGHPVHTGMTLRDYFAAKAMQADMSTYSEDLIYETPEWFEARTEKWYAVADAMLKARGQE